MPNTVVMIIIGQELGGSSSGESMGRNADLSDVTDDQKTKKHI